MAAYVGFIETIYNYIYYYIFTQQVQFYEDYCATITYYSEQNPLGCELYKKQLEYLKYLQNKENKKNKPK